MFGSAGREDNKGKGAGASSAQQGTEPAAAQLFPLHPSPGSRALDSPRHPRPQQPARAGVCLSLQPAHTWLRQSPAQPCGFSAG